MKSRNNQTLATKVSAYCLANVAVFLKAFHYACTTQEALLPSHPSCHSSR